MPLDWQGQVRMYGIARGGLEAVMWRRTGSGSWQAAVVVAPGPVLPFN